LSVAFGFVPRGRGTSVAQATDRATCVERHRAYSINIADQVVQPGPARERVEAMAALIQPGENVLDVGCNSGYFVEFLPRDCRCSGVDVSRELVKKARKRLEFAEVAEAESLPFEDKSFDVVVLGEILEHVYEPTVVLEEAVRVARRAVIGSTPHVAGKWGTSSIERHRFHVRCFTTDELRAVLRSVGLTHVSVSILSRVGVPQIQVFGGLVE
jgi:2-polyprenyl-3-methyl-5-hydroxy-6-metoxy-1,4-benzoquinol methylase